MMMQFDHTPTEYLIGIVLVISSILLMGYIHLLLPFALVLYMIGKDILNE